jgi:phosphoglycerate dehydrogenase-like enzyme
MPTNPPTAVAVLDDYQGVALRMADWSVLHERAEVTVFRDHLSESAAVVTRLLPFDVVCVMRERTPLTGAILEQLPNLKLIASTGARNASIDLAAARARGIVVCGTGFNPAHPNSNGTAELTWALILAMVRHVPTEAALVRHGGWQTSIGADLEGKTLGVVGLGRIGGSVAKIAGAFGMKVTAWSQNLTHGAARQHGARLVGKDELFREADIVTIHLMLSDRTRGIIGARDIRMMKPSAYLVNTSRGPLVDEGALIDALRQRKIAGAALDVYDTEPLPPDHPFRSLDNVLATPHIGFVTQDTYETFYGQTVEIIVAWLDGKPVRVMG